LNNQQSAESLSMNLIDDSGKENQNAAANYYEHENRKLRVMNEQLLQEISQVKATRQPILRKQNSSSSIGRRQ
jgi:DNA anti-recombination protein RmuC